MALLDIPIWDIWARIFISKGENGKKLFARAQKAGRNRQGFIIAGWDAKENLLWWRPYSSISDSSHWERFDNDRIVEEPILYKKLATTLRHIQALRKHISRKGPCHVGLAFWKHPEATDKPLQECLELLQATQFPGCPTQ